MPELFNIESAEKSKPILLVYGKKNPLIKPLVKSIIDDLKIIYLGENANALNLSDDEDKNIYFINKDHAGTLNNLEEKIDYAVIFIENESDKKNFFSIVDKLEQDNVRTAVIISVKEYEPYLDIILDLKKRQNFFVLLLGDLFGENIDPFYSNVSKIIQNVKTKNGLQLSGNGLLPIFPISDEDALKGIGHIIFGISKKNKISFLFYKHPQTLISSIHMLRRVDQDLEVKFDHSELINARGDSVDSSLEDIDRALQSRAMLKPEYLDIGFSGFEKCTQKLLSNEILKVKNIEGQKVVIADNNEDEKIKPLKKIISAVKKDNSLNLESKKKGKNIGKKRIFLYFSSSIAGYILLNVILLFIAVLCFKSSISAFQKNDFKGASRAAFFSAKIVSFIDPFVQSTKVVIPNNNIYDNYDSMRQTLSLITVASQDFSDFKNLMQGGDISLLQKKLADLYFVYSQLDSLLLGNSSQKKNLEKIANSDNSKIVSLASVLPQILGYHGEKTYLLLFQNNGELRPTGGFIGSVGEITLLNGKVTNFLIRDVYEPDGQLKGHVEPHYIIRRYLQPHLYLRDSNFDPDFEISASHSALLYNLETKKQVDGVVAIDYEVLRQIIGKVGPIDLPDYKKTLDANNAFDFIQNTIESNFFPGSSQKKDILNAILNQISLKISDNPGEIFKIASLTPELLEEKHILFAFRDNSIQSLFVANDFSGSLEDLRQKKENSVNDFLSINEANIGVSKANIHVKRSVNYETYLTGSEINSKATISIYNSEDKSIDYKAYLRVITPLGSTLTSIKINGIEQKTVPAVTDYKIYEAKGFKPPPGLEVDSSVESGKQAFGFIVLVPKNSSQVIEVSYKNGAASKFTSVLNYSLLYIKQPGTENYQFGLNVNPPEGFAYEDGKMLYNNKIFSSQEILAGDKTINLKFVKK